MKAITLHQPWAQLIADGEKTIETRSWAPPPSLVGELLAVHAGKTRCKLEALLGDAPVTAVRARYLESLKPYPLGCVLAVVRLTGFMQVEAISGYPLLFASGFDNQGQRRFVDVDPWGDFSPGRYLWFLELVERLPEPVPAAGRQRLWDWVGPEYAVERT